MSSRYTLETYILRIREVIAINPANANFIQQGYLPSIGNYGQLVWYDPLTFFNMIFISSVNSSVFDILDTVQAGVSTIAKIATQDTDPIIVSTIAGLGTSGYLSSTQYFDNQINNLSGEYGFISSTTLYDVIAHLGNLDWITANAGPMSNLGSNLSGGYVSTTSLVSSVGALTTIINNIKSQALNFGAGVSTTFIIASTINSGVISSVTLATSSITSFTATINYLNASSISTYSMAANNLTVQGSLYTSSLYLPNDINGAYTPITIYGGSTLSVNGSVLVTVNQAVSSLVSTTTGLGSAGYLSSGTIVFASNLTSTVIGLGSSGYLSSIGNSVLSNLTSSLVGLASIGYISTLSLQSTVAGLGSVNYVSTTYLQTSLTSTMVGLGSINYMSSASLTSTVAGLYNSGYVLASTFNSTVVGLGSLGY